MSLRKCLPCIRKKIFCDKISRYECLFTSMKNIALRTALNIFCLNIYKNLADKFNDTNAFVHIRNI